MRNVLSAATCIFAVVLASGCGDDDAGSDSEQPDDNLPERDGAIAATDAGNVDHADTGGPDQRDAGSDARPATSGANGSVCSVDGQCRSGTCGLSAGGARFCYGSAALGAQCSTTFDCSAGICTNGVCTSAPTTSFPNGASCVSSGQCSSGNCGTSVGGSRFCYGSAALGTQCATTFDCAAGICASGVCAMGPTSSLPNGASCASNAQCTSGNCGTSVGGDHFCYGSAGIGAACNVTQDCASGICQGGMCKVPGSCSANAECAINAICNEQGKCQQVCGQNAVAGDGTCDCLPGFQFASSDPSNTNCVRPSVLPGCHLFAQDNEQTYLGVIGNCFASNSVCNKFGQYGSQFATDSIFNKFGQYGSEFASYSAFNKFSSTPPLLVCDGQPNGCLSVNQFACSASSRIDPTTVCSCN